ncbi:SAM-dependent methyltransferase [Kitasatospora purpeofusca]|nr:methyltransferase domain-containing protein [Kitasatospora purpeofusca]MDY0814734.1 SAM-dependent methyltransferase [Kitasatospora purpeofusca]
MTGENERVENDDLRALLTERGQALLAELREFAPEEELALATRLRKEHPAELVSAAFGQARLRQRARAKFGADADLMYFTPNGVEQSTRREVAEWRAERFAGLGVKRLADLCCGIGGDVLALARAGIEVLAVDRDPAACAALAANAAALGLADLVEVRCADVAEVDVAGYDAVFTDPARRTARGRVFDPEAYAPPLSWAIEAGRRAPVGALKVAPGIPHEAVPADAEAEWVSDHGDVKEAVLWFGTRAGHPHRATLLPQRAGLTGGDLPDPPAGPVGRYLYEPDGAVIRAHLVAEVAGLVNGRLIDPKIAYLTSDELVDTPYAHAFELTDVLPFHIKKLKALLRERKVGTVVIKKRGMAITPEELRRQLRPTGPNAVTVVLSRTDNGPLMMLGHPVTGPAAAVQAAGAPM